MKRRIKDALKRLLLTVWDAEQIFPESVRPFEQPKRHSAASIYLETR